MYNTDNEYRENERHILYTIEKIGDKIKFRGFNMGGKIKKEFQYYNVITFKIGGCVQWQSLGERCYYSPEFLVGYIDGDKFHCKYEIQYNRETRQKALGRAQDIMNDLFIKSHKPKDLWK